MNEQGVRVPFWMGALIGALFTPVMMVVFFLGERLASLPFLPFDLFDWLVQVMPAELINFGKETMVDLLIALGNTQNLDEAGKTAERLMGIGLFWGIGFVSVTIFFIALNIVKPQNKSLAGWIFAGLYGLPFLLISQSVNISSPASPVVQFIWGALIFLGFGSAVVWAYEQLSVPAGEKAKAEATVEGVDRRQFLIRMGGATATITVIGAGLGTLLSGDGGADTPTVTTEDIPQEELGALPNADAAVQPVPGTRAEVTPVENHYRIDILSSGLPSIPEDYTLPITGLVANEVQWSLDDIREMPSQTEYITMSCISNRVGGSLISTTKWTGVSFQHILEQVQPDESATAIKITGADNFDEFIDLDLIRNDERIMLTYAWDDAPLPLRNGFPLRTHIPNRFGMKQPKWITNMEFVSDAGEGYWVRRGWSAEAIAKATSVIDTVSTNSIYSDDSGQMFVPVGGIAWAGDREIVRVEVSVDGGEWEEAQLREPISGRTWTIWRYDWPFTEGEHTFEVRCYEAAPEGQSDPVLQTTAPSPARPDGATGIHSRNAVVRAPETETEEQA